MDLKKVREDHPFQAETEEMRVVRWDDLSILEKEALIEEHNHGGSSGFISVLEPVESGKLPWDYVVELGSDSLETGRSLILDGYDRPAGGEKRKIRVELKGIFLIQIG